VVKTAGLGRNQDSEKKLISQAVYSSLSHTHPSKKEKKKGQFQLRISLT